MKGVVFVIDVKAIQEGTKKLTDITLEDLFADAEERGNEDAVKFLMEEQAKLVHRERKATNKSYDIQNPISRYRTKYLKLYAGYETKTQVNLKKRTEEQRKIRIEENNKKGNEILERLKAKKQEQKEKEAKTKK